MDSRSINKGQLVLTVLAAIYFVRALIWPQDRLAIYLVDFVFHEAGHLVFGFDGKLLADLGGTLMQLLLPSAIFVSFCLKQKFHNASLILFWIGENWTNVAIYARDARTRMLPLHGGEAVTHDWSEILLAVHALHYDAFLGNLFMVFAWLSMLGGLLGGIYLALHAGGDGPFSRGRID